MYDVIVVGAGPTGSTAAKVLAEKGYKVLLIEKFRLPRYKSCSGVLIKKSIDLIKLYFGENLPSFTMCEPAQNCGMIFTNDNGQEFRFEQEGLNIWRDSFDFWLTKKAMDNGVQVRDCTSVISCEETKNSIILTLHGAQNYTEEARFVIDCEGIVGTLKRKLVNTSPEYITTFQTFNEGSIELNPHYFYAYLQPELSQYDAWFNVKDKFLILGVSVKDTSKIEHFYENFLYYMKKNHNLKIHKQMKSEKWLMPHIRPGCHIDYGVGRVLFSGEIAGFLNPMGEGISAGMESGYYAACSVAENFDNIQGIYNTYRDSTRKLKSYMERQWSLVGDMADTFSEMRF